MKAITSLTKHKKTRNEPCRTMSLEESNFLIAKIRIIRDNFKRVNVFSFEKKRDKAAAIKMVLKRKEKEIDEEYRMIERSKIGMRQQKHRLKGEEVNAKDKRSGVVIERGRK